MNWNVFLSTVMLILLLVISPASGWQSDNGDGTFTNPVLYADYPDPDIIRVGSDFYMVSTTFADSPGINVLRSQDLVNWDLLSHAASTLDMSSNYDMLNGTTAYRQGMWASSIRYHNGIFYIVVNPVGSNARIYYTNDPAGTWNYYQLDRGAYDPGFFIDDDGTGYIVCGASPQSVLTLNSNYSAVVSQKNNVVNSGGEGSHVIKRGSYYYLFNANPGIWPFQLRCSRATNIFGPWETGHICLTATTGGHQGAIVDIDENDNWFGFVHQDSGAVGRMPRIGPVFWENDWPVFGTPSNRDVMASTYPKPILGKSTMQPSTSDTFSTTTLGLQWQWNHNPDNSRWSLTERSGYLRLHPTHASDFWTARNTLTQKGQGPQSHSIVKLDISGLQDGDIAGFGTLGSVNGYITVTVDANGNKTLGMAVDDRIEGISTRASNIPFSDTILYLRTDLDFQTNQGNCSYSADGTNWISLGGYFTLKFDITYGTFQGEKYAIFCYNPDTASSAGYVDVDSFSFGDTANPVNTQRGRPMLNAAGTTFVGDNGHRLRGPYESTEWTTAAPQDNVALIKDLGFNTVHLYAESFGPDYPAADSTAPGYAVAQVDKFVQMTRDLGLYLVITIGNGAYNGNYNYDWVIDFWNFYAPRYADETHVLYEIQNEPVAWGPPYSDPGATPPGAIAMEVAAYNTIRAYAPDTPVLLFSYAVLGGSGGANAALTDINAFNTAVGGDPSMIWDNAAIGFHGYAGWEGTSEAVAALIAAGYPCFMTEFGDSEWETGQGGFGVMQTSELERLEVSWLAFCYIPPSGVSDDVTIPEIYKNRVDRAGLSWTPDYGIWPAQRGAYENGGQPRATTRTFVNNFLTGTLRIEAEDFDTGGQGVACNDTDSVNQGGQYRTDQDVDIEATADSDGGYNVGWTAEGEWLEYSIFVPEPGFYNLSLRVASSNTGCSARVICYDLDKTGSWTIPNTGGAQTWTTITKQVFLEFGRQKLRFEILTGGFNLNWIELSPSSAAPIANGTYKLVNQNSGLVIENNTSTHKLLQNAYSDANIQKWNLLHRGAGQYTVQSVEDNYYWNTWGETMTWWGGSNPGSSQRFIVRSVGEDGYYRLIPVDSGMSYGVEDASLTGGAAIVQRTYNGSASQKWAVLSPPATAFPTGLSAEWASSSQVDLAWTASAGAASYNVKRSTASSGPYTTIAADVITNRYSDTDVSDGQIYYYVVSANTASGESLNSNQAVVTPWISQDVGAVGVSGSINYSEGMFIVNGSGADIWGTVDAFRFVYFPVTGDCTIVTRVASVQNTNSWAKAGVMIRESLNANSTNAFIAVTPGNGVTWQYRSTTGGNTNNNNVTGLIAPYWVKLVRSGNSFFGYYSPDGTNWTQLGNTSFNMASTVYVGMAVTSHNNSSLCSAVFDNVTAPGWPPALLPTVPTGLSATMVTDSQINLAWNAVLDAESYNVKRSDSSGGPYTTLSTDVTATSFGDTTVTAGVTYYYVVSANTAEGVSEISNEATPINLYAYLRYDETGGSAAFDTTGNGWTGALVNGPLWAAGKFGNAVDLDGTNDYVSFPTGIVDSLTDCTISAWVYLDSIGTWSRIFDFGTGTSVNMFLTPSAGGSNVVRFAITTGGGGSEQQINGSAALPTDIWTHVAVTIDGGTGVLYVNGWEVGRNSSMTLTPSSLGATTQNYLGRSQYSDPYLNGRVDEFRIYAEALSAAEVAALYTEQVPDSMPSTPADLSATAVSSSQVDLVWDGSAGTTNYNVKCSMASGGPYVVIASTGGTSFSDTGLEEGTTYYYVVSAVNGIGESDDSAPIDATTLSVPPAVPTGLTAAAGDRSVALNWDANTEDDLDGYNVYRSTIPGSGYTLLNGILLNSPEFTDTSVTNFVTYYYVVTAVDGDSLESASSDEVEAMPDDGSVVQLSAADFESGFGDWVNITGDDSHDWTRDSEGTPTPNTGPAGGASDSTWYIYLETSPGGAGSAGDTAILESPLIQGYGRILTFYYHMYGIEIGTLNVDVYDGTWHDAVWSLSGQQQSSGNEAYDEVMVDLREYTGPIQIRFRAVAAGGPRGDMAIDEIKVIGRVLYGDMDENNIVNAADLSEFAGNWLQEDCDLDLDGDCLVTLYEFVEFARNWLDDSFQK